MKLPLRFGLPLLALLLLGLAVTEGVDRFVLLVAAMGVALWAAFSLPHPGPRARPPSPFDPNAELPEGQDEEDEEEQDGDPRRREHTGPNGSGPDAPPRG